MHDAPYRTIPLRTRDGATRAEAVVDAADFATLSRWRWHLTGDGYAGRKVRRGGTRTTVRLHRQIMGLTPGDGLEVDHINGDKLDNRRANLRTLTHPANGQNRSAWGASSRHRGVGWHRGNQRWQAYARLNGKTHYLGSFLDEDEAARVAAEFRAKHMPFATIRTA